MGFSEKGNGFSSVSLVLCWQAHDFYETLSTALFIVYPTVLLFLNTASPSQYSSLMCFKSTCQRSFNKKSVVVNVGAMVLSCDIQFHYYKTPFL